MERCRTVISDAVFKSRDVASEKEEGSGIGGRRRGGGGTVGRES